MTKSIVRPCPQCRKLAELNRTNPYRPFCSERCRLIDLGEWADDSRRIPTVMEAEHLSESTSIAE